MKTSLAKEPARSTRGSSLKRWAGDKIGTPKSWWRDIKAGYRYGKTGEVAPHIARRVRGQMAKDKASGMSGSSDFSKYLPKPGAYGRGYEGGGFKGYKGGGIKWEKGTSPVEEGQGEPYKGRKNKVGFGESKFDTRAKQKIARHEAGMQEFGQDHDVRRGRMYRKMRTSDQPAGDNPEGRKKYLKKHVKRSETRKKDGSKSIGQKLPDSESK